MTVAQTASEIPRAPAYVVMTDRFMSGWGKAEGLTNRHVIVCPDGFGQACEVERVAQARPEMLRVRIVTQRPRNRAGVLLTYSNPDGWLRGWSFPQTAD